MRPREEQPPRNLPLQQLIPNRPDEPVIVQPRAVEEPKINAPPLVIIEPQNHDPLQAVIEQPRAIEEAAVNGPQNNGPLQAVIEKQKTIEEPTAI